MGWSCRSDSHRIWRSRTSFQINSHRWMGLVGPLWTTGNAGFDVWSAERNQRSWCDPHECCSSCDDGCLCVNPSWNSQNVLDWIEISGLGTCSSLWHHFGIIHIIRCWLGSKPIIAASYCRFLQIAFAMHENCPAQSWLNGSFRLALLFQRASFLDSNNLFVWRKQNGSKLSPLTSK